MYAILETEHLLSDHDCCESWIWHSEIRRWTLGQPFPFSTKKSRASKEPYIWRSFHALHYRELPARKIEERLPAGKNVATEKEEMMTQFKELGMWRDFLKRFRAALHSNGYPGPPRTVWVPTREERRAIQHVMSRLETVRFGSIPLDSTTNEMRIEVGK